MKLDLVLCPSQMKCQGRDFNITVLLPLINKNGGNGWPEGIVRLKGWYLIFGGTSAMFFSEADSKHDHFFDRNGAGSSDVDMAIVYDWEIAPWMSPMRAAQLGMMNKEKPKSKFSQIQFEWSQTQRLMAPYWKPFAEKWRHELRTAGGIRSSAVGFLFLFFLKAVWTK